MAHLGDIQFQVKRQFGDEAGAQITDSDIARWVNNALIDIARKTEFFQASVSTTTTFPYPIPTDFLFAKRILLDNRLLQKTTLEEVDSIRPRVVEATTELVPVYYYMWGQKLYVYPEPTTPLLLELFYVQRPAEVAVPADEIPLPLAYHEDIIRYCLARAKELDDDYAAAAMYQADYDLRVGLTKHETQNPHDSFPSVRVLPGDDGYDY